MPQNDDNIQLSYVERLDILNNDIYTIENAKVHLCVFQ